MRDVECIHPRLSENKASFVLEKAERLDAGEYVLTLANDIGMATLTITVIVQG